MQPPNAAEYALSPTEEEGRALLLRLCEGVWGPNSLSVSFAVRVCLGWLDSVEEELSEESAREVVESYRAFCVRKGFLV